MRNYVTSNNYGLSLFTSLLSLSYIQSHVFIIVAPVFGCVNVTCSCPQTCEDVARGSDNCSTSECKPGCQCPSGTVLDNGLCLNATTCPCYHEGKVYKVSSTIGLYALCRSQFEALKIMWMHSSLVALNKSSLQ